MSPSTPDEARSDLMLAGAAFFFGPFALRLLLDVVPLPAGGAWPAAIAVAAALAVTVAVPVALLRYRREGRSAIDLRVERRAVVLGAMLALPVVAAGLAVVSLTAPAGDGRLVLPVGAGLTAPAVAVVTWAGLAMLVSFATAKARTGLRGTPAELPRALWRVGRVVGLVVAVPTVLLVVGDLLAGRTPHPGRVLVPVALVAAYLLLRPRLHARRATTVAALTAPAVLAGLGGFIIAFDVGRLITAIWQTGNLAAFGLLAGAVQESERSAVGAFVLAVAMALFSGLVPTRLL